MKLVETNNLNLISSYIHRIDLMHNLEQIQQATEQLLTKNKDKFYLFFDNNIIKGFIWIEKENPLTYNIKLIYILEQYQKQGKATHLLQLLEKQLGNNIILKATLKNLELQSFYEKLGFNIINTQAIKMIGQNNDI